MILDPRLCSVIRDRVPRFMEIWLARYPAYDLRLIQGVRSPAYQAELYAKGRTTPGPGIDSAHPLGRTVTNADGVRTLSNHQLRPLHGETAGHAVDLGLFVSGDYVQNDQPYRPFHEVAAAAGLYSGWDFPEVDPDHLQCSHNGILVPGPLASATV